MNYGVIHSISGCKVMYKEALLTVIGFSGRIPRFAPKPWLTYVSYLGAFIEMQRDT
jgi:hypothetical protein